ncbi:GumC family protein [Thauera phenolivorans]|uniref:GumC family protein n=1 Tax=Thauera phenolivorans TaxID=1792543 RepID=UPI00083A4091|nr:hypothetical protein [Thauera phenolivorans]
MSYQHAASPFDAPPLLPGATAEANRRRLRVFLGVFVLAAVLGLGWIFLQPALYRADARLQIRPPAATSATAPVAGAVAGGQRSDTPTGANPFLTEVQVLGSRPVLERAVARLNSQGYDLGALGPDPVGTLQQRVEIAPAGGTQIVALSITGSEPALLAPALNAIAEAYRDHIAASFQATSGDAMASAEEESRRLDAAVATKLAEVEDFRARHNIVSMEREENQILARVKGIAASLNTANEEAAIAEGRLRSLEESVAAGRMVVRARDNPTLANLEQRASQIREQLRELERSYTPEYIALDPRLRSQRDRLAELEQQIVTARREGEQAALAEAREAAASARETAERLRRQAAADQQEVQRFTARFNEYKALQDGLSELQTLQRAAAQRATLLQASEQSRMPAVQLLEPAVAPGEVWRPRYARDAAIALGAAFVLGLLAMWFVELFNRQPAPPPTLVVAQPIGGSGYRGPQQATLAQPAAPALAGGAPALLEAQADLPRELARDELLALLHGASEEVRVAILLLLHGLSREEAIALDWNAVALDRRQLRIEGDPPRTLALQDALAARLARCAPRPGEPVLTAPGGGPLDGAALDAELLCAAHDAGLEDPAGIDAAALRHAYLAFLVRQGIRFADLAQLVGRLPADEMGAYSRLAPSGPRLSLEAIRLELVGAAELDAG